MSFGRRQDRSNPPATARGPVYTTVVVVLLGLAAWRIVAMLGANAPDAALKPPETSPETAADATSEPDLSRLKRFPNVTITWYDVPGTDGKAIFDYMAAHGPVDKRDGFRAHGTTTWRMNWEYAGRADGSGCDTARVKMRFGGTVLLPRLTQYDELSPRDRVAWNRTQAGLIAHEEGHLHIAYSQMETVAQAIRHSDCAGARAAADAVFARIDARNAEYDRETQHGLVESDKFPTL
ncbi:MULTISPECIES: DUF922 domain-containing protein [Asticcacaulis]|uniref:DUF922 domain-containing protein n=1 Tax=Asticcacaulis TaxID=76890 RepID=UPI001AE212B0|nr:MULTISPECIES: DUF922 domain-containing protein [Asticcacaulis]MBP2158717.1 putative secreted Zn-dependent protease [Asticcacaulis solisilvae]MDR6799763.1 putative secreted Zn-dependent protease [Asticcacaulis sp. BE141]